MALLLVGCSAAPSTPNQHATPAALPTGAAFDPAGSSEIYLPTRSPSTGAPVDVVVLVPGGGWSTADRSGLAPLAERLARAGFVAVNTTYRAGSDGARFPVPVQDVRCDIAYAAARAEAEGVTPGRIVVVGHSAGGHLAALAAVSGSAFDAQCPYPAVAVDALVGLAGVYDTAAFEEVVTDFFGASLADEPALWESGDPLHLVETGGAPTDLRVLLLHGDADRLVPASQSRRFADALRDAGIDVKLTVLPGETHGSLYTAPVAAQPVIEWLRTLPAG